MGVLERVGKGLVSFGTGRPQIDLDTQEIANRNNTAVAQQNEQGVAMNDIAMQQQQAEMQRQQKMRQLQQQALTDPQAMQQLMVEFPEVAQNIVKTAGLETELQREQAELWLSRYVAEKDPARQRQLILNRAAGLNAESRDPAHTLSLLELPPEQAAVSAAATLSALQSLRLGSSAQRPAGIREFDELTSAGNLSEEDRQKAARVQLGLDPRAGISADERIAESPELTEKVAGSKAEIRAEGKFAEMTAGQRASAIDEGAKQIFKIEQNVRNLEEAIAAVDAGAKTGAIISKFPSIRAASIELDQIQGKLGLDVVGAVSFGALSKGELDLAKQVAIPATLKGPDLKKWLQDRQAAQLKLIDYFYEQIEFLNQGGTVAEFIMAKRTENKVLTDARDAISKGADAAAIRERLQSMGIDPGKL